MSAANQRTRSQAAAAALVKRGIWHGKRESKPRPNSGGTTMTWDAGSTRYKRLVERRQRKGARS